MDNRKLKRNLGELDVDDRRILYWKCHGLNNEQIADRLNIEGMSSHSAVHNRLLWIQGKLDTKDTLNKDSPICTFYYNAVGYPPDFDNWPPPILVVNEETTPLQSSTESETELDPEPPPPQGRITRERAIAILGVLVFVVALAFIVTGAWDNLFTGNDPTEIADVTPESTTPAPPADTPEPDEPTEEVEQDQPPPPPLTDTPQPTDTLVPTQTISPTDTLEPSITPSPTETPTSTPTSTPSITPTPDPSVREAEGLVMQATNEVFATNGGLTLKK